jgi:lipid-binding SYLF domain-containing protein
MEGMIWNANHVLDQALSPDTPGIPRGMIQNCKGMILLSVVEAGFVFSGNVGTGVVIAHKSDGSWSPPSAIGLGGIGFGFMVGAEVKDIVMCVMDDATLEALSGEHQVKIGGQISATLGPIGREAEAALNLSEKGIGGTYSYTFSKGIFGGIALESAILNVRSKENTRFYGKSAKAKEILWENAVECPKGKGIEDLHHKLELLREGKVLVPTPEALEKKDSMRVEAEKAGVVAKASQTDVVEVNAMEEAVKEKSNLE